MAVLFIIAVTLHKSIKMKQALHKTRYTRVLERFEFCMLAVIQNHNLMPYITLS